MLQVFKNGQGSVILRAKLLDSSSTTGAGLTGLSSASAGLIIATIADNEATTTAYTVAGSTIESITTLGTYAAPTATKCRFKEVDSTNHKGIYEFQFADARLAVASAKSLIVSVLGATNLQQADFIVPLWNLNPYDGVRAGLTALPNAAPDAAGGLPISDAGGLDLDGRLDAAVSSRMATYAQPTGFLAATFPSGTIANTTNIAAGTITTVTNLTNAPTNGDLTAAMKASVNAEADTALADVGLTTTITGRIDVAVSTRLASASYTAPPTAADNADAVWDEALAGHAGAGSAGAALSAAGSAGDPWSAALPGAYGAGTAGKIIGDNINATITSRLATSGYTSPPSAATIATAVWAEILDGTRTAVQLARGWTAALLGKASGLATTNAKYRNIADTKDVIDATVTADGNRTSVTLDLS